MGQARKNKFRESNSEIEFKPRAVVGFEVGASVRKSSTDCITFRLEDCTVLAERVHTGDAIFGDFAEPRIMFMGEHGVIGYAPAAITKKLMTMIKTTAGGISGFVSDFRPPRSVEVEVCI